MNLEPYALYPHQVTGVEFLARRGRAILGDDMGLGKTRQGERLRAVPWTGVAFDEAHFIKNASQRSSQALKILGVSDDKRAGVSGPRLVFLLTGTPMPNRPRDLFNLLRAVGHPAARSFISFARQYCGAYRNDYDWFLGSDASRPNDTEFLARISPSTPLSGR